MSIYITRPYLPPKEEYLKRVSAIFERDILTNQGPEVQELEARMRELFGVEHFQYVTNGTVALQLALRALDITEGEIITTPFSYVATTSSILWERCTPVFVDIEPDNFTLDPAKIEAAITPRTKAIMPVHVFGYACNVEAIQAVADKYHLKVIYDAAHTFAARYKGRALCSYGDISTLSFHATKLFHTIEGGACIVNNTEVNKKLDLIKRFGHNGDEHFTLGINAKQDEFNAAMGNALLPHLDYILAERKKLSELYDSLLAGKLRRPANQQGLEYNYAYYPVVFESEKDLLAAFERLHGIDVYPRRYFYPSLNTLPYLEQTESCPISEDISVRIACLPLFVGLTEEIIKKICELL
ncbi:DegT/DnrJ/EryC1/StrS aminotransferase family protein [uncultured Mailhella sp.]|uniref:DegT/DnrJ/EryC1/StrS family aminotransferase n=1 Tax=uncultured Mailhella sp. TaxID=1981031 RepID=UPI0025E0A3B9|nr:DegT/DnrJ/EryC1/StrS family aminotransferase [uncultured Mailhella sp.]